LASFPAVVISAPNSNRREYFFSDPKIAKLLSPQFMDATMLDKNYSREDIKLQSLTHQKILYGRELLNAEIGCAISNRRAQVIIAGSTNGGLILEDDARFTDLDTLVAVVDKFLIEKKDQAAVLSMYDGRDWDKIKPKFRARRPYLRSISSTSHTVCYALTPLAAGQLIKANAESTFVADWPVTNCKYYTSTLGLVRHGDTSTVSQIDNTGKRSIRLPLTRRLLVLSGFFYFIHSKDIGSFVVFLREIWFPRLRFYLSNFHFFILRNLFPSGKK
jgi:GR25 family glycosyltransferase involved in LPS biosynthesis